MMARFGFTTLYSILKTALSTPGESVPSDKKCIENTTEMKEKLIISTSALKVFWYGGNGNLSDLPILLA